MKIRHNKIYVALGSNLRSFSHKNVKLFFDATIFRLTLLGLKFSKKSNIWLTNPIPFRSGPYFFNIVVEFTHYQYENNSPEILMKKIKNLEQKLGKKIKGKNKQRVIDIDIIDYKGVISSHNVNLPHPRMHLRKFVLIPLNEINKRWVYPKTNKNCIFLVSKIRDFQNIKKK